MMQIFFFFYKDLVVLLKKKKKSLDQGNFWFSIFMMENYNNHGRTPGFLRAGASCLDLLVNGCIYYMACLFLLVSAEIIRDSSLAGCQNCFVFI